MVSQGACAAPAQPSLHVESTAERAAQAELLASTTILLAEDDAAVRELVARVLRLQGYQVVVAANGVEALVVATSYGRPFELLLTDVAMPRMGGLALASQMLSQGHARHVIYMTGYVEFPLEIEKTAIVLRKPFSPAVLAAAVQTTLAQ